MTTLTRIPQKEKWAFGLAGLGQNMVYNYATAYIMVFYTDIMGLLPVAVGTLMLVARVFDAVNDPLMGKFVDAKETKKVNYYLTYDGFLFPCLFQRLFSS